MLIVLVKITCNTTLRDVNELKGVKYNLKIVNCKFSY